MNGRLETGAPVSQPRLRDNKEGPKVGVVVHTSMQETEAGGAQAGGHAEPQVKLEENQTRKNERLCEKARPKKTTAQVSSLGKNEAACSYKEGSQLTRRSGEYTGLRVFPDPM